MDNVIYFICSEIWYAVATFFRDLKADNGEHIRQSILYLSTVCLVCDDVCNRKCYRVTHLNISAEWSHIFTKCSANVNIGLGSISKLFVGACVQCARAHAQRAWTCMQLLCIFPFFFVSVFLNLKPFLTENEKNWGHISDRYLQDTNF